MTAREAVELFRESYPTSLGEDTLYGWVSELEGQIVSELVLTHEGAPEGASSERRITLSHGADDELTVPHPYSKIYPDYLKMKSDLECADTVRYETSSAVFASSFAEFADYYNRTRMPLSAAKKLKSV